MRCGDLDAGIDIAPSDEPAVAAEKGGCLMADSAHDAAQVKKVLELIRDVKYVMLTTSDASGALVSRPLTTLEANFDGTLRFLVAADSDLALDVQERPQVNLGYADPKGSAYVSVSGEAEVRRDPARAKALWNPWAQAFFSGPDDPNVGVLEVAVRSAQYWHIPGGVLGKITAYVKVLTGAGDATETGTVEFRR